MCDQSEILDELIKIRQALDGIMGMLTPTPEFGYKMSEEVEPFPTITIQSTPTQGDTQYSAYKISFPNSNAGEGIHIY